jgi:threonine 3-dehydrogenase
MKALVKSYRKEGLWMEDVPIPSIKEDEVLIKTHKTSICGTDIHIYKWDAWAQKTIPVPMVVGHEYMGEIAEIGKNVKGLKVGDRVSGEGHITCSSCISCLKGQKHLCINTLGVGVHRHGCFAEYFNIPAENVFPLPPSIKDNVASIFDPYGNAVHTALTFDLTGEDVLITGAGPIGIMAAAIAAKAGAHQVVITDVNEYRLQLAKKLGAQTIVNVANTSLKEVMKALDIQNGFTVGMEMSGHPDGLRTLLENAHHGGKIALLGILPAECLIDWDLVIFKMLTIKGIYGREIFSSWFKMVNLLESGLEIEPLITHHYPIDKFETGFEVMMSGQSGKVILDWLEGT